MKTQVSDGLPIYKRLLFPALARVDPEQAHAASIAFLRLAQRWTPFLLPATRQTVHDERLRVAAFGLTFDNPVGLAAGFDKNAQVARATALLGFGHVEVGTVTLLPQCGQKRPRLFRLGEYEAIINRLSFPNLGVAAVENNLKQYRSRNWIQGVNIGPNADSVRTGQVVEDYIACMNRLSSYVDYITINVSSPNTKDLRQLESDQSLNDLLARVRGFMRSSGLDKPILVKISPDIDDYTVYQLVDTLMSHSVSGIIATNTTVNRPDWLRHPNSAQAGGLSGRPLAERSTHVIRTIFKHAGGTLPIVGVGGIFTAADALEKIQAGATLVQLYTGLVYEGPGIAHAINRGLLQYMDRHGVRSPRDLVGQGSLDPAGLR